MQQRQCNPWWVTLLVLAGFVPFYVMDLHPIFQTIRNALITPWLPNNYLNFLLTYLLIGVPVWLATWAISGERNILRPLGLAGGMIRGFLAGFVFTLPTLIGHGFAASWQVGSAHHITTALVDGVAAGLFEETFFRGFLFGQLFQRTRAGFVPIIVVTSAVFAAIHLTQSHSSAAELAGILAFTAAGSALFAWLYVEWNYNLWVPVTVHGLMDIWWNLFSAGHNAAGSLVSDVPRLLVGVLAVGLTLLWKHRRHEPLAVNRATWWWRRAPHPVTRRPPAGV